MPTFQIEYELRRATDDLPAGNRTAALFAPDPTSATKSLGAVLSLREGLADGTFRVRSVTQLRPGEMLARRLP